MKAIVELTKEEYATLKDKRNEWLKALGAIRPDDMFCIARSYGYAHYTFRGTYKPELVDILGRHPDADEIIMHVDGGFSHFGATCTIDIRDCSFAGRVNTD